MGRVSCNNSWLGDWKLMKPLGSGLVLSLVFKALGVYSTLELYLLATENHLHPPELGIHVFSFLRAHTPLLGMTSSSTPFLKIWLNSSHLCYFGLLKASPDPLRLEWGLLIAPQAPASLGPITSYTVTVTGPHHLV